MHSREAVFVALIPAAGVASRLPEAGSSKEILPVPAHVGWRTSATGSQPVICHLLSSLRLAGVAETRIVVRTGKWDIPERLCDGSWDDMNLNYRVTPGTSGVPETVAFGLRDLPRANVLFGFPDILFEPPDAFETIAARLENSKADIVLGVFPTENPAKMDMVRFEPDGRVAAIDIKPRDTSLEYAWIIAGWRPRFTRYLLDMHRNACRRIREQAQHDGDLHLGHVLQLALEDGLVVEAQPFAGGRSLDIGTPADLEKAQAWHSQGQRN